MTHVIIIHGTKGSPNGNWFPWLAKKLSALNVTVDIPAFPTPENQSLTSWFDSLQKNTTKKIDVNTIIVGHSIGAVFLLRILEAAQHPIKASFFVAGLLSEIGIPEYDNLNKSFVKDPFNWQKINSNAGISVVLYGDNDPYVPMEQSAELADLLRVKPVIVANGGHLNSESGYDKFDLILEKIQSLL